MTLELDAFALGMVEHTLVEPQLLKACNDEPSTVGRLIQKLLDFGFGRIRLATPARGNEHANNFRLRGLPTYRRGSVQPDQWTERITRF